MRRWTRQTLFTGLVALSLSLTVLAHGDDEHGHGGGHIDMGGHSDPAPPTPPTGDPAEVLSYFTYGQHQGWLYLHILTMVVAWIGIMPIAVMLFIADSRLHLPAQLLFLVVTAVGIVFSTIYNSLTPDLYPGNSHHKLGWALVWILGAQAVLGVLGSTVRRLTSSASYSSKEERAGFIPAPMYTPVNDEEAYRHSRDSGHGSSIHRESDDEDLDVETHEWSRVPVDSEPVERRGWFKIEKLEKALAKHAPFVFNDRVVLACDFFYSLIARFLIPLAFVQLSLGVVTASGIFMGDRVFNGLAHFIKGGIFLLYGIFTLGRFLGAFADLGWAWNLKPPTQKWRPSAETVESGLIFIYGCSNVFLEHLAGWGQAWTHSDLQHASIAFMFFGGGLCGLLIESSRIRALLNPPTTTASPKPAVSINPLPALVIFLLGILMSQHHQHSALSTAIHTQWGALLAGASVFRLLTYMAFWRSATPVDGNPSRPPTELLASFALIAGGAVFMISNKDTVNYLEQIGVDAMFSLTVVVGCTALLMSWIVTVMAVKGWAKRREMVKMGLPVEPVALPIMQQMEHV